MLVSRSQAPSPVRARSLCAMRERGRVIGIYIPRYVRGGVVAHARAICKLSSAVCNLAESINKFVVFSKLDLFTAPDVFLFLFFFSSSSGYLYRIRDTQASSRKTNRMKNDAIDTRGF